MSRASGATQRTNASFRASGSSFNAAMRILPGPRREAMFEIYSFCRAVDDIADQAGPREARRQALAHWRRKIDSLYCDSADKRLMRKGLEGLNRAILAFGLRREDFQAVIDGMGMDVETHNQAPEFATLRLYCDPLGSAVARPSVCAPGMPPGGGE